MAQAALVGTEARAAAASPASGGNGGGGGGGFGGGIFNQGILLLTNCTVANNTSIGGNGGAGGTNGVGSGAFAGNGGAGALGAGAGLYNSNGCVVAIVNCTFNSNEVFAGSSQAAGGHPDGAGNGPAGIAGSDGDGGGIYNAGTNTIINSTFFQNVAIGGGGGNGGPAATGPFGGNGGNGGNGNGGGLCNAGVVGVTNCTFSWRNLRGNQWPGWKRPAPGIAGSGGWRQR